MKRITALLFLMIFLCGCAGSTTSIITPTAPLPVTPTLEPTAAPDPTSSPAICQPEPVIVPTRPAAIPGYTELDPSTGLHMTGTVQQIDPTTYRLKVTGKVDYPLVLRLDDLRCMPKVSAKPTLICKGNFEDTATWAGVSLKYILDLAGVQKDAASVRLIGADGYQGFATLEEAQREDNFLAYEWEGQPIPILHGFPVRAVMPSMFGSAWTKWLIEIQVK